MQGSGGGQNFPPACRVEIDPEHVRQHEEDAAAAAVSIVGTQAGDDWACSIRSLHHYNDVAAATAAAANKQSD